MLLTVLLLLFFIKIYTKLIFNCITIIIINNKITLSLSLSKSFRGEIFGLAGISIKKNNQIKTFAF